MRGAIPPIPSTSFMAWCLDKHRDNFTFTFTFTLPVSTMTINVGQSENVSSHPVHKYTGLHCPTLYVYIFRSDFMSCSKANTLTQQQELIKSAQETTLKQKGT